MKIEDSYLDKIQKSYIAFMNQEDGFPILLINTTKLDFVNSEEDFNLILRCLNKKHTKGMHRINL